MFNNINVWIPYQKEFSKYACECKKLYESLQDKINDTNTFEFICQNTLFFLFETGGDLIGAIYYFTDESGKLFLNGFAKRKRYEFCIKCLKMSLTWFRGRVYAFAQNRASALCLIRCGFIRKEKNLFVFSENL